MTPVPVVAELRALCHLAAQRVAAPQKGENVSTGPPRSYLRTGVHRADREGRWGSTLRADPGRVARDARVSWQTSLWFWMTQAGAGTRPCHQSIVQGFGFGETIRSINGALECNGRNTGTVQSRVDAYRRFCQLLGVDPGTNPTC